MERYINNTIYVLAQDLMKKASNGKYGPKDKDMLKSIHRYLNSIGANSVSFNGSNGRQYSLYPLSLVSNIKRDWNKIFPPQKVEVKPSNTSSEQYVSHSPYARKTISPFKKYGKEDDLTDMVTAGMANLSHDVYDYMYENIDRIVRESINKFIKGKLWV